MVISTLRTITTFMAEIDGLSMHHTFIQTTMALKFRPNGLAGCTTKWVLVIRLNRMETWTYLFSKIELLSNILVFWMTFWKLSDRPAPNWRSTSAKLQVDDRSYWKSFRHTRFVRLFSQWKWHLKKYIILMWLLSRSICAIHNGQAKNWSVATSKKMKFWCSKAKPAVVFHSKAIMYLKILTINCGIKWIQIVSIHKS